MVSVERAREKALDAQEILNKAKEENNNRVSAIEAVHNNTVDGTICSGEVLINYCNWPTAKKSAAMNYFGSVGAICAICGFEGRLDKDKVWA